MKKLTKAGFTNLSKIMYPVPKITKAQIIEYYIRMAKNCFSCSRILIDRFPW